jgi:hypothetical protein
MEHTGHTYRIPVGNPELISPVGNSRYKWENNILIALRR